MEEQSVNSVNTDVEQIKEQLMAVTKERDYYKNAYTQLSEQYINLWGVYSNTIDYIVTSTHKKDNK